MKRTCIATAALLAANIGPAVELDGLADAKFAEDYAFSTNRAALVETLRPRTKAWFAYSILNAQTEGRLEDADALLDRWKALENVNSEWDRGAFRALRGRQDFLCYDRETLAGKDAVWRLKRALDDAGVKTAVPAREKELPPNTYPSVLDQKSVSFDAFSKSGDNLHFSDKFLFLAFLLDPGCKSDALKEAAAKRDLLPDTPGMFDHLVAYMKSGDPERRRFSNSGSFANLTLAQLDTLAKELKNDPRRSLTGETSRSENGKLIWHRMSDEFVDAVLGKLAPGADAEPGDFAVREALLKRRMAFAESLGDGARRRPLLAATRALLEFYSEWGLEDGHVDLFWKYLKTYGSGHAMPGDALIGEYLVACRKAARRNMGAHPSDFTGWVDCVFTNKKIAEFDLLSGKPAAEVDTGALSPDEFKKIQERVELNWARSNKRRFASSDDVTLSIDVKNVPKMRVAVYELDAAAACRAANGEARQDIDLDCAVPTHERIVDYSQPSVVRHRETLSFPELKEPGLYVVECSGRGVASRALVRKGRLRATERRDAAGHVFTAFDEDGRVAKGSRLWIDGTVFKADESGEISVPFATADKAGRKTAIVEAGRLATAVEFRHATEEYSLAMSVVLPHEQFVAGCEAVALVRPSLRTSGTLSTLKLVEKPVLTVTLTDWKKRVSVKRFQDFDLFDDAESVCRFKVPSHLSSVEFRLEGSVKRTVGGEDARVSATWRKRVNGIEATKEVKQFFLRRTLDGYIIECRGRTGEPVPYIALNLAFKNRIVRHSGNSALRMTLQADENGVVRLGPLVDICSVSVEGLDGGRSGGFGGCEWTLDCGVKWPYGEKTIASAEGEAITLPVRGLFDGAWPGANKMENRVSLLAVNKDGKYTEDCIEACSYSNGVLRIDGLLAGDYRLEFRTEDIPPVKISVVRTGKGVGDGGVVSGAARALADTGSTNALRIDSATVTKEGKLRVKLSAACPDARVHVFASRTCGDSRDGVTPFGAIAGGLDIPKSRTWKWAEGKSAYVSGRDLGDKLRYILDRRHEPGRIGNMLERPSLLLNPWTTSETDTKEPGDLAGEGWAADEEGESFSSVIRSSKCPGSVCASRRPASSFCRDFLPGPGAVFANLKPGADGVVEVDISSASGMQDVAIVATDGRAIDEYRLLGNDIAFAPRDLRVKKGFDALADSERTKEYSTVGELYDLLVSIAGGGNDEMRSFRFVCGWSEKGDVEKRSLYGEFACHELDFFLYEKDRAFFDAVVAPHLKNKRLKDFMDRWLLGEDVSEYAKPGRLQDLNALEQCLLARRCKDAAPAIARALADWCEANPVDPGEDDRRLSVALAEMEENDAAPAVQSAAGPVALEPPTEWVDYGWSGQSASVPNVKSKMSRALEMEARRVNAAPESQRIAEVERRRNVRRFWSPPERTREWVESHWYRRRHKDDTLRLASPSRFWRDYAAAIAAGNEGVFRSPAVIDAAGTLTDMIAAIAVTQIGFSAKDGESVAFSRGGAVDGAAGTIRVERHFFDGTETNEDGSPKEVADEFVRGVVYQIRTIVMNPTARKRRARVVSQLPEGAFPVAGGSYAEDKSIAIDPYGVATMAPQFFYFPTAEKGIGRASPAVAVERGGLAGASGEAQCAVVAESSKRDTTSWRYVSQKAKKGEVLEYLRTKNLANVDLAKIGWRFADGGFAKKATAVLAARGAYCRELWLAGLTWKDAFDESRIREALSRRETKRVLAPRLGPVFKSSLVEIGPEETDVFEHREYWPLINARAHAKDGAAAIANASLAKTYRKFLDVLAAKKELSAADRLLAAVYFVSQDRIPEAEAQVAAAEAPGEAPAETKMQLDYLKAYLAFSRGDAAAGRKIAEKWKDAAATPLWRGRFREVVAEAGEAASGAGGFPAGAGDAASAPSIALKAEAKDGVHEGVVVTARNLAACTLKAYPVDAEIGFSKDPFGVGGSAPGGLLGMKPAWTGNVALAAAGETRVPIPAKLRNTNLVLVATGADGRVEERLELTPGTLDLQAAKEYGTMRVRDAKGRPVAGAYVKVYSMDASGGETKFHKDGYTDVRGAFDYAGVSTDVAFRPARFAIFVQSGSGVKILRVKAPNM